MENSKAEEASSPFYPSKLMKHSNMSTSGIEQLGLSPKVFRYLSSRGIRTVEELLANDPETLVIQASRWEEIADRLALFAEKNLPWKSPIVAYLDAGWSASRAKRELLESKRANDPDSGKSPMARALFQVLRRQVNPMPLRVLRRQVAQLFPGQAVRIREILNQEPGLQLYPYGRYNWVGLTEWGQEGYRKAARAAWSVLPVHLGSLLAERRVHTLSKDALFAIAEVAEERADFVAQLLCSELADAMASVVREPVQPRPEDNSPQLRNELPSTDARVIVAPTQPDEFEYQGAVAEGVSHYATDIVDDTALELPEQLKAMLEGFTAKAKPELFVGLDPDGSPKLAVSVICKKAAPLDTPFSLVQLKANTYDYAWLKKWARQLPSYVARGHVENTFRDIEIEGERWSEAECFGVLFLFLAAEDARRHAKEGKLWDIVTSSFSEGARSQLFLNGQPKAETKAAMEAGARRLGLHHAFASEGQKAWYLTVFLQFGFTKAGIETLPVWLSSSENVPQACLQLLEDSADFKAVWAALVDFRRKRLSASQLEEFLKNSPFILSEWIPHILATVPVVASNSGFEDDVLQVGLLGRINLSWPTVGEPTWRANFALGHLQLMGDVYDVEVDGVGRGQILRLADEEGEVHVVEPARTSAPLTKRVVDVHLLDESGEDDRELNLDLWEASQDIIIFDEVSGDRISDRARISVQKSYLVLLASGLHLEPPSNRSHILADGTSVHKVEVGWNAASRVLDEQGQEVRHLIENPTPPWSEQLELTALGSNLQLEQPIVLNLRVPTGVEVQSARFSNQTLTFSPIGSVYEARVTLPSSHPGPTITCYVRVSLNGITSRVRVSTKADLLDRAIFLAGQWTRFDRLRHTCAKDLERARCRFFFYGPNVKLPRDWAILEGDLVVQTPRNGTLTLESLSGYGAPLSLSPGPYNEPERSLRVLANSVSRFTDISSLEIRGGTWHLGLARRLVGDDRFDLLFWDGADTTGTVHGADIDYGDGTRWSGPLPPVFTGREELAVAIACEGFHFASRLGSSFHLHADSGDARRVAGLMRWFRIPILARRWYEECRRLAIENLEAFVQGWIFDRSLATTGVSLQHSDDTGWHAAIRAVLKGATIPDSVLASTWKYLLQANSVRFGENTVRQVWRQLVESSPVLAVRLIRCANLKPVELRAALDEVTEGWPSTTLLGKQQRIWGLEIKPFLSSFANEHSGEHR